MANEDQLKFQITADGTKARAEIKGVDAVINKLGGGATAKLQKDFKGIASEASNLVGIFTGDRLTGATSQLTSFAGAVGAIPGPAGLAVGAIAGVVTAGAAAGVALFGMAKAASDYGSIIHDASVKTGLGAESISALKLAADQSGSSLEQVTGGIAKFSKTVGAAGDGSKEAAAKLKSLGIDPQKALNDLDGSLDKVFKRIGQAKPGVEQITLAQKAFGKSGADLIPLMEQVGYNFDAFRQKAKELGLTISDDAANKADEFGDQMVILEAQISAVGRTIGFELMPVFLDMSREMSDWLSKNKGEIQSWGTYTADVIRGTISLWEKLVSAAQRYVPYAGGVLGNQPGFGLKRPMDPLSLIGMLGEANRPPEVYGPYYDPNDPRARTRPTATFDPSGSGKGIKAPKESDDQFRKFFTDLGFSVNRTFGEALNANSPHKYGGAADVSIRGKSIDDIFTLMIKSLEHGYRVFDERVPVPGVKQTGPHVHVENAKTSLTKESHFASQGFTPDQIAYLQSLDKERLGKASGLSGFQSFTDKQSDDAKKAADAAAKAFEAGERRKYELGKATDESLIAFDERYYQQARDLADGDTALVIAQRIHDEKLAMAQSEVDEAERVAKAQVAGTEEAEQANFSWAMARIKADADVAEADDELAKKQAQIADDELKRLDEILGRMHDRLDLQQKLADEEERYAQELSADMDRRHDLKHGDIFGAFDPEKIKSKAEIYGETMSNLKGMTVDTFGAMSEAIGQSIAGWALYGDSIGASMKKATAAILANLAAQAITQAIWEVAQGFAMLALAFLGHPGAGPSASAHFTAAAIYASIGVGAAIGAKAVGGGGKGAGGGSGASGGGPRQIDQNPSTYSRVSDNAYQSGNRPNSLMGAVLRDIRDHLHRNNETLSKFGVARSGDVLMKGMRERPGAVGNQVNADVKRNSAIGRQILSSSGVK